MDFLRAAYFGSDRPTGRGGGREEFVFFFGTNFILVVVDRKYWGAPVSPLDSHI
jgi:hypothetical protein